MIPKYFSLRQLQIGECEFDEIRLLTPLTRNVDVDLLYLCAVDIRQCTCVRMLHNKARNANAKRLPIRIDEGLRAIPVDYNGTKIRRD